MNRWPSGIETFSPSITNSPGLAPARSRGQAGPVYARPATPRSSRGDRIPSLGHSARGNPYPGAGHRPATHRPASDDRTSGLRRDPAPAADAHLAARGGTRRAGRQRPGPDWPRLRSRLGLCAETICCIRPDYSGGRGIPRFPRGCRPPRWCRMRSSPGSTSAARFPPRRVRCGVPSSSIAPHCSYSAPKAIR